MTLRMSQMGMVVKSATSPMQTAASMRRVR